MNMQKYFQEDYQVYGQCTATPLSILFSRLFSDISFSATFALIYQVTIRNLLLMALDDSHGKICTAASMAVASIAHYDWPEEWPELMPFLLKLISGQSNMHGGNI